MTPSSPSFDALIDRFITDRLSPEEVESFFLFLEQEGFRLRYMERIDLDLISHEFGGWSDAQQSEKLYDRIKQQAGIAEESTTVTMPVYRIHFLKTAWFKYAAAIILLFGASTYLYINHQKEEPSVTKANPVPVQNDLAPGGNRATLTLADGSKILLDSAADGTIASEMNATIRKQGGHIIYDAQAQNAKLPVTAMNTMSTPRGGQYQLTLPDGSQAWLNAESSITYPTAFTGSERRVSVSGEVYFEVAKNKQKPFRVDIGTGTIEVLGTHFNVNTYKEEPTENITLLEGSVRIKTVHTSLTLKPGQQGRWNPDQEKLSLAVLPDVEQVMAWKSGLFHFNNTTIEEIMRQVARWYDVEVVYEGTIRQTFNGKIPRNVNVSDLFKILESTGWVHFRIDGRKITVTN
jgi:transmembrane sensor